MFNQENALKKIVAYSRKSYRAETEKEKKEKLSKPWMSLHKQMHTNLPNEITGEYYPRKFKFVDFLIFATFTLFFIAIGFMLGDLIFGAETVTNFIADLLGSLMG